VAQPSSNGPLWPRALLAAAVLGLLGWALLSVERSPSVERPRAEATRAPARRGTVTRAQSAAPDAAPALAASDGASAERGGAQPLALTGATAPPASTAEPVPRPRADEAARQLEENAQLAQMQVERYCEEAQALSSEAFPSAEGPRTKDAWAYMSVRIDWEGAERPPGLLRLAGPLRQRLREYGAQWPTRIRDYDLQGLDFTWMGDLHAFDHWDVLRVLRAEDPSGMSALTASIPNFTELMSWTKLRLGRALAVGDFAAASADVRQLAFLLRTTGLVVADMIAYRILLHEREAHAAAVAAGVDLAGWTPIAAEDLDRYRRVARSGLQFQLPGVPEQTRARAAACAAPVGKCSALYEGVGAHRAYGHLSAVDTSAAMAALAARSGCDARMIEWLGNTRQLSAEEMLEASPPQQNPLHLLTPDGGG